MADPKKNIISHKVANSRALSTLQNSGISLLHSILALYEGDRTKLIVLNLCYSYLFYFSVLNALMRLELNGGRLAWVALIEIAPQCSPASISASRMVTVAVMLF